MPTPGPLELVIILVIALLILGPGRLPDVGSALGKSLREFRKASSDIQDAVKVDTSPLPPDEPAAQPATRRARRRRSLAAPVVAAVAAAPAPVAADAPVAAPAAGSSRGAAARGPGRRGVGAGRVRPSEEVAAGPGRRVARRPARLRERLLARVGGPGPAIVMVDDRRRTRLPRTPGRRSRR